MKCPDCNNAYVCPCSACREREPDKTPWIRMIDATNENTWLEKCSKCGLTKDVHEWQDIEYKQLKEEGL